MNLIDRLRRWLSASTDTAPLPHRLRERTVAAEDVPPCARAVWPSLDVQVATIAVLVYNMVIDPATGRSWHDSPCREDVSAAFAEAVAMGQEEAISLSRDDDEQYLGHVQRAEEEADLARAAQQETEHILDDTVDFPPGARSAARSAIASHTQDRKLAAEREIDGDSRHVHRRLDRFAVAAAATALAAVDIMLLWRPLLNLGALDSAQSLYKWALAVAFSAAQALFVDLAISRYRERERMATERRDRARDANRAAGRGWARGNRAAILTPAPSIDDISAADRALSAAYRWLLLTAVGVGIIGVIRVVFLSRAGGQTVLEATAFGSFIGLMLGALVLLLGELACRGNALGDRLGAGAEVVADIESQTQEGQQRVAEHRDEARLEVTAASTAMAHARDAREWVIGQYWQALLLAARWLGLPAPPVEHSDLVIPRELSIAEEAAARHEIVATKLREIDDWLTPRNLETGAALEVTTSPSEPLTLAPTGRLLDGPSPGQRGGLVSIGSPVPEPPSEPRWLLAVAVVATVTFAYLTATIAPVADVAAVIASAAAVVTR